VSEPVFSDRRFCSEIFVYLQHRHLLQGLSKVVLAVSGGLDSMVMLDFFRRFGKKKFQLELVIAHLDHGLRPDSPADAQWLAERCQAWKLQFVSTQRNVRAHQTASEQSSLEAVARELRYGWLAQVASEQAAEAVFTAHSASDQLETSLMHWLRGSVSGLQGILPRRPLEPTQQTQLIRPLLSLPRAELQAYATHHGLSWREDPSNQQQDFLRNRLRQELIPWLLRENPRLPQNLSAQSEIWADEQAWLRTQAIAQMGQAVSHEPKCLLLDIPHLLALHPALQRLLLREVLTQHLGSWKLYTHRHIEALRRLATAAGGSSLNLPGALQVTKTKQKMRFQRLAPDSD